MKHDQDRINDTQQKTARYSEQHVDNLRAERASANNDKRAKANLSWTGRYLHITTAVSCLSFSLKDPALYYLVLNVYIEYGSISSLSCSTLIVKAIPCSVSSIRKMCNNVSWYRLCV